MFDQENYQRFDSSKIRVYAWYKDASNKNITITGSTEERLKRYYSQGYEAVRCDCFYLNYISYGNNEDWKDYLNCPLTDYAVGGEISMWGEYVDATNLEPRMFPRASAAAQHFWTGKVYPDLKNDDLSVKTSLHKFKCFMISRGIRAQHSAVK